MACRPVNARLQRGALYAGGFLGPFGGGVLTVLIPDLRTEFGVSTAVASLVIPAYIVPFAALQLVSGTIGERFGARRTTRLAYVVYAIVSIVAAAASGFGLLLGARAMQGVANAFTTPLLLSALAADTRPEKLGRTMGAFAAVQTAAIVVAPLLGGIAGEADMRLVFTVPALAALALALVPLPAAASRAAGEPPPRLRTALNRRVAWLAAAAFLAYLAVTGLGFLVALHAADEFGAGATQRGLLLAGFGVTGIVVGPVAGDFIDRLGQLPVTIAGALACAVITPLLGIVGSVGALAAVWALAGVGSAVLWTGLNTLTVEAAPANRGGAVSFIGSWKFAGNAAGPIVWLPIYAHQEWLAFALAGVACLVLAFTVLRASAVPVPAR
jgi:MFS family permease